MSGIPTPEESVRKPITNSETHYRDAENSTLEANSAYVATEAHITDGICSVRRSLDPHLQNEGCPYIIIDTSKKDDDGEFHGTCVYHIHDEENTPTSQLLQEALKIIPEDHIVTKLGHDDRVFDHLCVACRACAREVIANRAQQ